jgi:hypothetical protein
MSLPAWKPCTSESASLLYKTDTPHAKTYSRKLENLRELQLVITKVLTDLNMPTWDKYIADEGPAVWSSIHWTRSYLSERKKDVHPWLYDGVGQVISRYMIWDDYITKWADEAEIATADRPDIARIMNLAYATKESSMPFETDIGGALVRSATGVITCANCPTLAEEARVIVDKLLAMDWALWKKHKKLSEDENYTQDHIRHKVSYPRQTIAHLIARLYGDRSMDPLSWVLKNLVLISESATEFIARKSDESKGALYDSIKTLAQNVDLNGDQEFEPYRQFTAGQAPGTATIPEYKGSNLILKGLYKAYRILVGK